MEIKKVLQLAEDEVKKLREEATEEELSRLDLETFHGLKPAKCVYGQMTGFCFNPRATELISKCAVAVSLDTIGLMPCPMPQVNRFLKNGDAVGFTAMEHILEIDDDIKDRPATTQIVNYLKGETDHLDLVGLESLYV